MENLGRRDVTEGAQDAWAGTGFACTLPGGKGWRVSLRIEHTADSNPWLTLVNPPGLTVSSRSPNTSRRSRPWGLFHTPA